MTNWFKILCSFLVSSMAWESPYFKFYFFGTSLPLYCTPGTPFYVSSLNALLLLNFSESAADSWQLFFIQLQFRPAKQTLLSCSCIVAAFLRIITCLPQLFRVHSGSDSVNYLFCSLRRQPFWKNWSLICVVTWYDFSSPTAHVCCRACLMWLSYGFWILFENAVAAKPSCQGLPRLNEP